MYCTLSRDGVLQIYKVKGVKVERLNPSFIHCIGIMVLRKFIAIYGLFITVRKKHRGRAIINLNFYIDSSF